MSWVSEIQWVRIGVEMNVFLRELKAWQQEKSNVFLGKVYQWNDNVQVVEDKPAVEICEI